jgi:hypothetical protein
VVTERRECKRFAPSGIGQRVAIVRDRSADASRPLLLFNREGDCLAAKLRPGEVRSAEGWEELLLPEIERQQQQGKEVVFLADAAFAKRRCARP